MYWWSRITLRAPFARSECIWMWLGRMGDPRLVLPQTHVCMWARVRQTLGATRRVSVANVREARVLVGALRVRGVGGGGPERPKRRRGRVCSEAVRAALPAPWQWAHLLAEPGPGRGGAAGRVRALSPAERDAEVDEHERDARGG